MTTRKRAYSVAEAAEALGVSTWLIREAVRRGEIYCTRIGRRIIIPSSVIDEILCDRDADAAAVTSPAAVDQGGY